MSRRNGGRAVSRNLPSSNIIEEPSTLVYSLLNPSALPFEHFSLIVRSLHKYMVEDIQEHRTSNTVHVKLQYQASVKNAFLKLGPKLAQWITICKLSQFVKDEELPLLDELRRKYGFSFNADAADDESPPCLSQEAVRALPGTSHQNQPKAKRVRIEYNSTDCVEEESP